MAKQLLASYYTVDSANDTIVVDEHVKAEELLLITDVTNNKIIYQFSDSAKGFTSVTYDEDTEQTTIVLDIDMSAESPAIDDDTQMQIFVDRVSQKMDVHDSFLDPVHKIRVSTPENLIDTDFEYGLQSTKWETLERSNNVPSFFTADGETALDIVQSITASNGSDILTVTCDVQHGLVIGTPIDIQGLSSRSAEGKFLVKSVPSDESFTYQAAAAQTITGNIGTVYTTITPGQFYSGSQINYQTDTGIETDENSSNSTLTITTPNPHGFVEDSAFYLLNTVAVKKLTMTATTTDAADGNPHVDDRQSVAITPTVDLTKTETKKYVPVHHIKFDASAVSTSNNTIAWTNHRMRTGDTVIYIPPSGDTAIGGLDRLEIYFVSRVDDNTISLSTTRTGSAISLTSAGTYNYGRACIGLVYHIRRAFHSGYRQSYAYAYTYANQFGNGSLTNSYSGWDVRTYYDNDAQGWGLSGSGQWGTGKIERAVWASRTGRRLSHRNSSAGSSNLGFLYEQYDYTTNNQSAMVFGESTTTPNVYHPYEHEGYFNEQNNYKNSFRAGYMYQGNSGGYIRMYSYNAGYYNVYFNERDVFWLPMKRDPEGDTLFSEDHGLLGGGTISFTKSAGDDIKIVSGGGGYFATAPTASTIGAGTYGVEKVSDDRFRLTPNGGGSAYEINQVTGTYSWSGTGENATKNSFYIPGHGLASGDAVTIGTANSGVLPTTPTGAKASTPGEPGVGTTADEFAVWEAALDSALTDNSVTTTDFVTSNLGVNTDSVIYNQSGGQHGVRLYLPFNSGYVYQANQSYTQMSDPDLRRPFSSRIHAGISPARNANGNNSTYISKQISNNQSINRHMSAFHIERPNTSYRLYFDVFLYAALRGGTYTNQNGHSGTNSGTRTLIQSSGNYYTSASGENWEGLITWSRIGGTASTDDFYIVTLHIQKGTTRTDSSMYGYAQTNNSSYLYHRTHTYTDFSTTHWHLRFAFTKDDATTLSTNTIRSICQDMIDHYDANWAYPSLSAGTVYANVINTNRISLRADSPTGQLIELSGKGSPDLEFQTEAQVGAIDGVYTASNATTGSTLKFETGQEIVGQTYTINGNTGVDTTDDQITFDSTHNLLLGGKITYDVNGNTAVGGLTDDTDYYAIIVDDTTIQLGASFEDALGGNAISLTAVSSGTHNFKAASLAGMAEATGTVDTSESSPLVTGTNTLFKRTYKPGDTIFIKDDTDTPGQLIEREVISVPSDLSLQLDAPFGRALTGQKHFSKTAVYARPDGFAIHRPFDGGVEIAAGTAPFSQITRQTRKYFRYQSGKGIQTSLAINFNPPITFKTLTSSSTTATGTTLYPHRMVTGQSIKISGAADNEYNGDFDITVTDDFTFTFTLANTPSSSIAGGIAKFNLNGYSGAATRAGMFDDQNGFFFEYNGSVLSCVRRSSVTQLSGTIAVTNDSQQVVGTDTLFNSQLVAGDQVVIRGQTYRVVSITNATEMFVQPEYRGVGSDGIILTKTEDVKVPQDDWNIDKCDGEGPEGFTIDLNKIQMAYMDYSWYGAGKIRFGFKDRKGHVRYVHEFIHNNRLDEAYMRSGNIPARYEVINEENPTYAPKLFHWGTSVIMDGTFDDDKAYLFTATSRALSFTGGDSNTATANATSTLTSTAVSRFYRDYYVRLSFPSSDSDKFPTGTPLFTSDESLNGDVVDYIDFSGNSVRVYIYVGRYLYYQPPAVYPSVSSGEVVNIGAPASGAADTAVDLGTDTIPLVSLRLAPSADSSLTGFLGERDILNRMQLKMNEVGLVLTHDCEVKLILNGDFSAISWETVGQPSLSQLQKHQSGETVSGGVEIFNFRASGGATDNNGVRLSNTQDYKLGDLVDLGNAILGGDGVFPNGPDVITVAVKVSDTFGISASSPFKCSARITWAESQA